MPMLNIFDILPLICQGDAGRPDWQTTIRQTSCRAVGTGVDRSLTLLSTLILLEFPSSRSFGDILSLLLVSLDVPSISFTNTSSSYWFLHIYEPPRLFLLPCSLILHSFQENHIYRLLPSFYHHPLILILVVYSVNPSLTRSSPNYFILPPKISNSSFSKLAT